MRSWSLQKYNIACIVSFILFDNFLEDVNWRSVQKLRIVEILLFKKLKLEAKTVESFESITGWIVKVMCGRPLLIVEVNHIRWLRVNVYLYVYLHSHVYVCWCATDDSTIHTMNHIILMIKYYMACLLLSLSHFSRFIVLYSSFYLWK